MTTIVEMPAELINHILCCSNASYKAVDLWKCGSRVLNAKLAQECLEMDLVDEKWNSLSRFPKMLLELRQLRSLRLSRGKNALEGALVMGRSLRQLSSTLEKLELECLEAEACFLRNPPLDHSIGSFEGVKICKQTTAIDPPSEKAPESRLWDVVATFPNLTSLSLIPARSTLVDTDLPFLPCNLTYLKLQMPILNDASLLPRALVNLNLSFVIALHPGQFIQLPRSLCLSSPVVSLTVDDPLLDLPRSLESMHIDTSFLSSDMASSLPYFPLVNLDIADYASNTIQTSRWTEYLPASLSSLCLTKIRLSASELRVLPHTITKLNVWRIRWSTLEGTTDFPPKLRHLAVQSCPNKVGSLRASMWSFPTSIEELRLGGMADPVAFLPFLPDTLKSLVIVSSTENQIPYPHKWPSCLTDLDISVAKWHTPTFGSFPLPRGLVSFSLRGNLNDSIIETFPGTLKSLRVDFGELRVEQICFLPKGLTSLYFDILRGDLTFKHIEQLPRSLTSLEMMNLLGKRENEIFNKLPPLLVRFRCNTFSLSEIHHLPRSLQFLGIRTKNCLTEEHIASLPRNLRNCAIFVRHGDQLGPNAWKLFPPHLTASSYIYDAQGELLKMMSPFYQNIKKMSESPFKGPKHQ